MLKQEEAWIGVNMDGGGSSTLVIEENGELVVLNIPTGEDTFGKQRPFSITLGCISAEEAEGKWEGASRQACPVFMTNDT